jgi:D-glycero-D-manno-heptose 1,7-bisphosphate phosphatase
MQEQTVTIFPKKNQIMVWKGERKLALCLDLDGTIRHSKNGDFIDGPDDIALFDGVEAKIWAYRDAGFLVFGISNQGGVAYGHKTPKDVEAELKATLALFERNPFHIVKQCYHMEGGEVEPYNLRSLLRKPNIGMLALCEVEAFEAGFMIDWNNSAFIGDRDEDRQCAESAGMRFIDAEKWRSL